jgi:hypothetical protein
VTADRPHPRTDLRFATRAYHRDVTGISEQTARSAPASIVTHAKAETADAGRSIVRHSYGYARGHVNPDGSFVHPGPKTGEEYLYIAPDATRYTRSWQCNKDGSPTEIIGHSVMGPVLDGAQTKTVTIINHADHTYTRQRTEHSVTADAAAPRRSGLDLESSPPDVQQALQSGQATRKGTTTLQGTPALAISITVPAAPNLHRTLYVDAQTYQPLRTVTLADGNPQPYVADRMPATPANIAKANDHSIPPGYTNVDQSGES